jgi:beta-acetyl hexosaminidase like
MGFIQALLLSLCLFWQVQSSPGSGPIWPQPAIAEVGEQVLWIDRALTATFHCGGFDYPETLFTAQSPGTVSYYADMLQQKVLEGSYTVRGMLMRDRAPALEESSKATIPEQYIVRSVVRQSLIDLHGSTFVPWKFHKRHLGFEPDVNHQHHRLVSLEIKQLVCPLTKIAPPHFHDGNEAYKVIIQNETAVIEAPSTIGTLRALGKSHNHNVKGWAFSLPYSEHIQSHPQRRPPFQCVPLM